MAGLTHPNLIILSGAGLSAESGVATFRAADGLWEGHRIEDVATPEAFRRDPALVQQFYNLRRAQLKSVQPNAAHHALVELEKNWPGSFWHITQNVDDLHERAGSPQVLHMHGELLSARCLACEKAMHWADDLGHDSVCRRCRETGELRPDIVWFGEMPYSMDEIYTALAQADVFVAIGTSGKVYPAAGFVSSATLAGAHTIEFNLQTSDISDAFTEQRIGPASVEGPRWVEEMLG
jgi:NAD-dependent deacetylase